MDCIFCKIVNKEIPATIIYESEDVIAFNDIKPRAPIHKLIIPRKHIATLNDINEADIFVMGRLLHTARHLAKEASIAEHGYRVVMNCNAGGGQEVFHVHLHLLGGRSMNWPPG